MYEIEKGIEMPEGKKRNKYPLSEMEVGDSFYVQDENDFASARSACSHYGIKNNKKFRTQKGSKGGRIWRIE